MDHLLFLLERAESIARAAHAGQVDKGGHPYIGHPQYVSAHCKTLPGKIVGWLHDVLEDTNVTMEDLRAEGFDEFLLEALDLLTKKNSPDFDESDYYNRIKQNEIAKEVKLNDLLHNKELCRIPHPTPDDYARTAHYIDRIAFLRS